MKRPYELTFIVRIDPSEEVMNDAVNQVKAWVEANNAGQVTKIERWGRRRLAYEIDKQREGYYVHFVAEVEPQSIAELETNLRLATTILRHLVVRQE